MTTINERNWYVSEQMVGCDCGDEAVDRYGRHNRRGDCPCDCHQPPHKREMWIDTDDIVGYVRCKSHIDKSTDGNTYRRVETTVVEECTPDGATHVIIRGAAIEESDGVLVLTSSGRIYRLKQQALVGNLTEYIYEYAYESIEDAYKSLEHRVRSSPLARLAALGGARLEVRVVADAVGK